MESTQQDADLIVIGAGPAGLMAAIAAARRGCRVVVLERQDTCGRKLLASGGGRCNITTATPRNQLVRAFGAARSPIVSACLRQFGPQHLTHFIGSLGVSCVAEDGLHYYPASDRAADVLTALTVEAERLRVKVLTGCDVQELVARDGFFAAARCTDGIITARACVLAAGGCGFPALGGSRSGYDLAARLGYSVVEPVPGLVGLIAQETWPGGCAGITLDWSRIMIPSAHDPRLHRHTEGSLLFTHRGISGPAALDISASVSRLLACGGPVELRCLVQRETDSAVWLKRFEGWQQSQGGTPLSKRLSDYLPQRLVDALLASCGCQVTIRCADVSRPLKVAISGVLTEGLALHIRATEGWDRAMVAAGGVSVDEIDAPTMAGKLHRGLFFAGEIVDCDGPCGGFNLTWAFGSGWVAGNGAAGFVVA